MNRLSRQVPCTAAIIPPYIRTGYYSIVFIKLPYASIVQSKTASDLPGTAAKRHHSICMPNVVTLQFFVKSFHTNTGCRMPALPRNPSSMTKERLAEELKSNNISLPSGRSKKEVYVELYKRHLLDNSPRLTSYRNMSVNTSPKIGFSSDEEDDIVVQKNSRKNENNNRSPRKASKKLDKTLFEDRLAEVEELSDGDLRKELQSRGIKAGPIVVTTRAVYERKLADVLTKPEKEEEQEEPEESPEEMENGYSDSDVDGVIGM